MAATVTIENLTVSRCLFDFIEDEALPGTAIRSNDFWQRFSSIINELSPINKKLLAKRDALQASIDDYHQHNKPLNFPHYKQFLNDINYLVPPVEDFAINTNNVDNELALMAGPQLVVPIMNARFALNAVNARWGSLYDALYGTDAISNDNGAEPTKAYNPVRGKKVIAFAKGYLDQVIPLVTGSHSQAVSYHLTEQQLMVSLADGQQTSLKVTAAFIGFTGSINKPESLMFTHNGLHLKLVLDNHSVIGQEDAADLSDIMLESALTTIMDCEDSVAAVNGEDKVCSLQKLARINDRSAFR